MLHIQIFNHHIKLPYVLLWILEFTILVGCAYISVIYSGGRESVGVFDPPSFQYGLIFASVMMLSAFAMGVYEAGVSEGFGSMMVRTVVSYCLLGALAMLILYYLVPALSIGRGALFGAVMLALGAVLLLRRLFYSLVDIAKLKRRILVLGAGKRAKSILDNISEEALIGSEIVGFIPTDQDACEIEPRWLLNAAGGIERLVKKHHVDEIVIAADERRRDRGGFFPLEDLLDCKMAGTQITEVVEFYEREFARIELPEINTSWMVFSDQFRYSLIRDKSKRLFDLSVSLVLLFFAWPFMLLTAVSVYLESGSPIIYRQDRVGFKGRVFPIYKFRSMCQDAEKDGKAKWAQKNDSRITRVGAFIRNTRLDELPQIFNVLRGEMSFVGPRPERPEFVAELNEMLPFYDLRHRVKPGIMGWAQLKYSYGASLDDAANKLVYDLYYVKNHSLLLDVLVAVQSVEVVLLGKGVR
ncbi:MAG TPA: TIGR03013 family PEP-CTERM/XrtA system glycosyltransferase [Porticoccus sp.]|nr:TIGR03013 family PEP-CTERM/XrtA system glycosyltransferase [Porticoccus sp.]